MMSIAGNPAIRQVFCEVYVEGGEGFLARVSRVIKGDKKQLEYFLIDALAEGGEQGHKHPSGNWVAKLQEAGGIRFNENRPMLAEGVLDSLEEVERYTARLRPSGLMQASG